MWLWVEEGVGTRGKGGRGNLRGNLRGGEGERIGVAILFFQEFLNFSTIPHRSLWFSHMLD